MTRKIISSLMPNNTYSVRVRAIGTDGVSAWTSQSFVFTTISDTVLPAAPQSVTWVVNGDSFHGEWDSVTENTNGESIAITRYEVELVAGATKIVAVPPVADGTKNVFDLPFEANTALFGTAKASIAMRVRAVDNKELLGAWSVPAITATNLPPADPASITATAGASAIGLSWSTVADTDLVGYRVYVGSTAGFTPSPSNRIYQGGSTAFTYTTTTYSPLYFKVSTYDKFGQESGYATSSAVTASSPFVIDSTIPNVPAFTTASCSIANNASGIGARANLVWTIASPPSNLAGFYVRYRKVGDSVYSVIQYDAGTTSATIELQSAYTNYEFQIKAFTWQNYESAWSSTMTLTSPVAGTPAQISGVVSTVSPGGILYTWTPAPEANVKNYEVQVATNSGFTTGLLNFNTGDTAALTVSGLTPSTNYFMRVRAVNVAGTAGPYSTTDSDTTGNYNGVITSVSADIITPGTLGLGGAGIINIGAGADLVFNGGKLRSNTFNGTFTSGIYNNDATAGFYLSDTNLIIMQGKISASALSIGGTVSSGNIILSGTGTLQTSGYNGTSGFRLSSSGLDIPNGSLEASKIDIRQGRNIIPVQYADFEFPPSYYSNQLTREFAIYGVSGPLGAYIGKQSLSNVWNAAGAGIKSRIWLGATTSDYNIPMDPAKKYILSFYGYSSASTPVTIGVKNNGVNSVAALQTTVNGTLTPTAYATRPYAVYQPPAGTTAAVMYIESDASVAGSWRIDAVQVEEVIDNILTPSPWRPPLDNTVINGGQISTGSMRSNDIAIITAMLPTYDSETGAYIQDVPVTIDDPQGNPAWNIDTQGDVTMSNLNVRGNVVVGSPNTLANQTYGVAIPITTTSGSNIITVQPNSIVTDDIGDAITSTNLPANTTIVSINSSNTALVTVSANATVSGTDSNASVFRKVTHVSTISSANYVPGDSGAGWTIRSDGFAEFRQMAANSISINSLGSGKFSNEIELLDGGKIIARGNAGAVWMDSTGFYSTGTDGTPFISFPNTVDPITGQRNPNIISGKLTTDYMIVGNGPSGVGASMNKDIKFETGSITTLMSNVQPPAAPLVTKSWPSVPIIQSTGVNVGGLAFSSGAYRTLQIRANAATTVTLAAIGGTETYQARKMYQQANAPASGGIQSSNVQMGTFYTSMKYYPVDPSTGRPMTTAQTINYSLVLLAVAYLPSANQFAIMYKSAMSGYVTRSEGLYVAIFNSSTGNYIAGGSDSYEVTGTVVNTSNGEYGRLMSTAGTSAQAIATDYVNNRFLISYLDSSNNIVTRSLAVSGSNVTATTVQTIPFSTHASTSIVLVGYGAFDFGANRYVYRDQTNKQHQVYNGTVAQSAFFWPLANTTPENDASALNWASAWDPFNSKFRQFESNTWRLYEYASNPGTGTGTTFTSGAIKQNWVFKASLYDSNGDGGAVTYYETDQSGASTTLSVYSRCQVTVSLLAKIPYNASQTSTPDMARVWVNKGSGTYSLAGNITQPDSTINFAGGSFPGTVWSTPVAPNLFPAGDASILQSAGPGWLFRGDGYWKLGGITSGSDGNSASGGITYATLNYSATGWQRITSTATADSSFPLIGGMTTSGGGLVIPRSGIYVISGSVGYAAGSGGPGRKAIGIDTSAASANPAYQLVDSGSLSSSSTIAVTAQGKFNAGDVVYLYRYTDTASLYASTTGFLRATQIA